MSEQLFVVLEPDLPIKGVGKARLSDLILNITELEIVELRL